MKAFRARLGEGGERPLVELPFDAREAFGKARAPVRGRVNGTEFRVGFMPELRKAAGIEIGDEETRRRRAAKAVEMLRAGTKHP
jgi:hypothetical protein